MWFLGIIERTRNDSNLEYDAKCRRYCHKMKISIIENTFLKNSCSL